MVKSNIPNAKILVRKGQKQYFEDLGREVSIVKESKLYVSDFSRDFATTYGSISKADLKKTGTVKSSQDKEFRIFDASFIDLYRRIKRAPQIIPMKDIGYILAQTGVGSESTVVEGGSGSGALALMLARCCKKVYSYEIEPEHLAIAKENAETLGFKNIVFKNKSMYDSISEKDIDLVCMDLPAPWEALASASKALKQGGFVVSYSPTIIQTSDFVNAMRELPDFVHLKTVEVIEREWEVDKRKVRPKSKTTIHSGFITIGRKI
ncbi:MAG: methyltransferase domain-containing protein [Candidatus Woesearchaeota archaeon]